MSSRLPNSTMDFFNLSYSTLATLESTLWPLEDTSQLRDKVQAANMTFQLLTPQEMKPQCRHREWEDQAHLWEGMQGPLWWEAWGPVRKYCNISVWGCFSLKKALVGGDPSLRASSTYLNTSSHLLLGLHICCALKYLLKINPSIKPRGMIICL